MKNRAKSEVEKENEREKGTCVYPLIRPVSNMMISSLFAYQT